VQTWNTVGTTLTLYKESPRICL